MNETWTQMLEFGFYKDKSRYLSMVWPFMPISQSFFDYSHLLFEPLKLSIFVLFSVFSKHYAQFVSLFILNKIIWKIWIPPLYLFVNWYEITKDALDMHRLNLMSCKTKINVGRFCFYVYRCRVWFNSFIIVTFIFHELIVCLCWTLSHDESSTVIAWRKMYCAWNMYG